MFLIIGYIVLSFMLRITGGANSPMAFIKSRARMYDPNASDKVTFSDVA
jgi:ATP-dependent Zn protease